MGRPRMFSSPEFVQQIVRYGVNPVAAFRTAINDVDYGRRLNGSVGHVAIGDPQTTKRTGWLPAQQGFVGAMQLTNLVNAKVGLSTAIPATKPNPGVVGLTAMQQQLLSMAGRP